MLRGLMLSASLVIACLAGVQMAAGEVVNRVVAVVGDEVITAQDQEKTLRKLQEQVEASGQAQGMPSISQMRRLALDKLIEDKILEQEIKRLKISVAPAEIDNFIERIKKGNHLDDQAFAAQLSRRGISLEEYRNELKSDILRHKLLNEAVKNRVVISDQQVEQYLREQKPQYEDLGQVRLRALFLTIGESTSPAAEEVIKKRAEELRQQVVKGADLAELARKFSQGPGAKQGGELGPLSTADLLPEMRQALAELKPGETSPVIKMPGAYVFMQLIERGGKTDLAKNDLKEQIREKLEKEALEKRFREWLKELRANVYVKIME